jgi:hypothetical protein
VHREAVDKENKDLLGRIQEYERLLKTTDKRYFSSRFKSYGS